MVVMGAQGVVAFGWAQVAGEGVTRRRVVREGVRRRERRRKRKRGTLCMHIGEREVRSRT